MQGFIPILFLWVIFAFIGKITKASQAQQKKAAAEKKAAAHPAKPLPSGPKQAAQRSAAAPAAQPQARPSLQPAQPHTASPLEAHMHEAEMDKEGEGTEGIDCCHEFMLSGPEAEPEADLLPMTEASSQERAHALLQGVIYSEILGRRPVRRFGGKHA